MQASEVALVASGARQFFKDHADADAEAHADEEVRYSIRGRWRTIRVMIFPLAAGAAIVRRRSPRFPLAPLPVSGTTGTTAHWLRLPLAPLPFSVFRLHLPAEITLKLRALVVAVGFRARERPLRHDGCLCARHCLLGPHACSGRIMVV